MGTRRLLASSVASTHYPNGKLVTPEESDVTVRTLKPAPRIDVDGEKGAMNTHERIVSKRKTNRVKAEQGEIAPGHDSVDVSVFDNDVDPAEGYLKVKEDTDGDDSLMINNDRPDELTEDETDGDVWYEELEVAAIEEEKDDFDEVKEEDGEEEVVHDEHEEEKVSAELDEDEFTVLDVDGVAEDDVDEVIFASADDKVLVLKASRVIAEMTVEQARKHGVDDIFTGDNFQDATLDSMQRQGVRAGLKEQGFVLATINVGSSELVNKRVEYHVAAKTKGVRASLKAKDAVLDQCLAIASVGMNRGFFKDRPNTLAASLVQSLSNVGVRNADRVVRAAFAKHGVTYAKEILALAMNLTDKGQDVRNQLAATLDLVDDSGEFDTGDNEAKVVQYDDDAEGEFANVEYEEEFIPATVTAALAQPGTSYQVDKRVTQRISASAADVLSGDAPLF